MNKKSIETSQVKKKALCVKYYETRKMLKKRIIDQSLTPEEREKAKCLLDKLPKRSSAVRLRNICSITRRSRGYMRTFGISRICFKELAMSGMISGVELASW